ncbi:hypothetical protein L1276_001197 [Flavobacterium sp. HSC-32F16]|uniref:hypothetical protein n=1 Tax=Flavobacterium sp. HSC-32F16 TaxID=2910964 RepID=UPI0020A2F6E9|nr:hypothetical protein [Flavobacterium sp. HSC-32F16]MCP2026057.1 hypothetical protein [Flavobacterium sp. HSC-32F16]
MSNFPSILTDEKANIRNGKFIDALFSIDEKYIDNVNFVHLVRIYHDAKELNVRNKILKLLYNFEFPELKDFFNIAYKKERYLDMKIYALRGLTKFISEKEIEKLLHKFNATLKKRQESTPYNYQEYELLRGKNALPYLLERYHYDCFRETLQKVNEQYEIMPEVFKGIFTIDENGELLQLKNPEETSKSIRDFFDNHK